jgi:hypothetical protein
MLRRLRPGLPSPAMVVAVIALIVALSGSALAASGVIIKKPSQLGKNVVTGKAVKNGSLSGSDIKVAALGTVPAATNAGHATVADRANSIPSPEAWHLVGNPGEPAFQNGWNNTGASFSTAAYFKDLEGIVHLRGSVTAGISQTIFTLPAGYRPSGVEGFAVLANGGSPPVGSIAILPSGTVNINSGLQPFALDGISFRAEG